MNTFNGKILLANNFFYFRGGSEEYFYRLMDLLRNRGHEVIPFSTRNSVNWPSPYEDFFASPIDTDALFHLPWFKKVKVAARIIYSTEASRQVSRLIDKTSPSLAHCQNIYGALSPSILRVFKKRSIPVILSVHDMKLLCPNHRMFTGHAVCEKCRFNKYYQCTVNKCIGNSWTASFWGCIELYVHHWLDIYRKNVDMFVTFSAFYKRKLIDHGFDEKRIFHISSLIDAKNYMPSYEHERYLIYFGRLEESKGPNMILEAAARLREVIKFVIVGHGPMKRELEKEIYERKLDNIKIMGRVSEDTLFGLIRNAMFTIVPSLWYENSPHVILESYACAKAVIGSKIGGIPELIDDGKTGLLFRAGDVDDLAAKIEHLAGKGGLAVQMGREAREKAINEFGPEKHYEKMLSLYKNFM